MTDSNKEFEDRLDYLLHCKLGKELTMDALIQGRNDKWFEYVEIRDEILKHPDDVTVEDAENLNDKLIQVHQLDVTVLYSNYNILDQRWKTREAQERETIRYRVKTFIKEFWEAVKEALCI